MRVEYSRAVVIKNVFFCCDFHYFQKLVFLDIVLFDDGGFFEGVFPPESKCEALLIGVHLILLYFIRILVVGTEIIFLFCGCGC